MTSLHDMLKDLKEVKTLSKDDLQFIEDVSSRSSKGDFIFEISDNDFERLRNLHMEHVSK